MKYLPGLERGHSCYLEVLCGTLNDSIFSVSNERDLLSWILNTSFAFMLLLHICIPKQ